MSQELVRLRRALISVTDKSELVDLAQTLTGYDIEIISSGGTAKHLRDHGISVTEVTDFTGAPEMLDGRLKTLHPKIHAGILAVRSNAQHLKQLKEADYSPIDLVIVNLYAFEEAVQKLEAQFEDTIEKIDIGGPTLLRAGAKNFTSVTVIVEPSQYKELTVELSKHKGKTSLEFRQTAARRVFERTAAYDSTISQFFQKGDQKLPVHVSMAADQKWSLRYGENPHQRAGFYLPAAHLGVTTLDKVLQGKELSYNNLLDIHAALELICELNTRYAVAILKHTNPCGVGLSEISLEEAYLRALECDPVSAFGGVVVFSRPVDETTAAALTETFTEVVIAPEFSEAARKILQKKKNLRVLEIDYTKLKAVALGYDIRRIVDGYLLQERDLSLEDLRKAKVVTTTAPSDKQHKALDLAWRVAKHVKSNAIVIANECQTVGIGAGQMSRVDSSKLAAMKARPERTQGAVLASDAFFPFRDSVDEVAAYGITAIVQPGGSIRDDEVIQSANDHNISMLFTGVRHFRH